MPIEMPILRPVPIPTKGEPWWKRLFIVLSHRRKWELVEDYYLDLWDDRKLRRRAPFIFDGASVPIFFWWIPGLSPTGILLIPALFHDDSYQNGYIEMILPDGDVVFWGKGEGRKFADHFFLQVDLWVNGVIIIGAVAWAAIRLGGWKAWKEHRKNDSISQTTN